MASLQVLPAQCQRNDSEEFFFDFSCQAPVSLSPPSLFPLNNPSVLFPTPQPVVYTHTTAGLIEDFEMQDEPPTNPFNIYGNPEQFNCVPQVPGPLPAEPPVQAVLPLQLLQKPRRRRITLLEHDDPLKKSEDEFLLCNPDIRPGHLMEKQFDESLLFIPNNNLKFDLGSPANNSQGVIPGYENDYLFMDDFDEAAEVDDLSDDDDDDKYFHVDDLMGNANFAGLNQQQQVQPPIALDIPLPVNDLYEYAKPEVHDVHIKEEVTNQFEAMQVDDLELPVPMMEAQPPILMSEAKDSLSPQQITTAVQKTDELHTCEQINPATGKPCFKHFSRPYDLIRHQETIHARKKRIFRCVICEGREEGGSGNGKSKTFSRGDALSRHIKVKHNLVGKDAATLINMAKDHVEFAEE